MILQNEKGDFKLVHTKVFLRKKKWRHFLCVRFFPQNLGSFARIICSGQRWERVPFVYDQIRISHNALQARNCARFLKIFELEVGGFFSYIKKDSDKSQENQSINMNPVFFKEKKKEGNWFFLSFPFFNF